MTVAASNHAHGHDPFASGFEQWGSFAGPPSRPIPTEVESTSLLLQWEPPVHLGGSGFEVVGYQVLVQYGGQGGYHVHIPDSGTSETRCIVEELVPDSCNDSSMPEPSTSRRFCVVGSEPVHIRPLPVLSVARSGHEFEVRAITAAGTGAPSQPSCPVLTDKPPELLRELLASKALLATMSGRLARRRDELLKLARSGTMALRLSDGASADEDRGSAVAALAGSPVRPTFDVDDEGQASPLDIGRGAPSRTRLTAKEARAEVHRRRGLEKQIGELEDKISAQEIHVARLQATQAGTDAARRDALAAKAGFVGMYGSGELSSPAVRNRISAVAGEQSMSATDLPGQATEGVRPVGRRDFRRLRHFEAYSRLFAQEDNTAKETFAEFDREAVREQLQRALSQHVLQMDGGQMRRYFNLALNRARSAVSHNVFDRFGDPELEQLVLLFARFDADHDGVLEFGDFCRLMLLVGGRVGATYHERDLRRMFAKVDLNDDRLMDLNEFLWMVRGLHIADAPAADTEGMREQPPLLDDDESARSRGGSGSDSDESLFGVHGHPPSSNGYTPRTPGGAGDQSWMSTDTTSARLNQQQNIMQLRGISAAL